MALILYKENTRTRRFASKLERPKKTHKVKALSSILQKHAGRSGGRITVGHQGGRHKRFYRTIDFRRDKLGVKGKVEGFEYDPNRNVNIGLISYPDGDRRYILAPKDLKVGDTILAAEKGEIKVGNAFQLKNMPIGTPVHNVE